MLAILSRRSSKVSQPYICSSCFCNILIPPIAPSTARPALFSTTAAAYSNDGEQSTDTAPTEAPAKETVDSEPNALFNRVPSTKRRPRLCRPMIKRPLSNSALEALRESLQTDEEEQNLSKVEEKKVQKKVPNKVQKKAGEKKVPKKVQKKVQKKPQAQKKSQPAAASDVTVEVQQETADHNEQERDVSSSAVEADKSSKSASPKSKSTKPSKKKKPVTDTSLKGRKNTQVRIRKHISTRGGWPQNRANNAIPFDTDNARVERSRLVKAIQDGSLPETERRACLRILRDSLLTKIDSGGPKGMRLKDAMLSPGSSKLTAWSPLQRPHGPSLLQPRVGIEIPYTVGAPRAGNRAPLERSAPGPVKDTPPPKHLTQGMTAYEIETVEADELELTPLDTGPLEVPKLAYGLERVLFNPGVYHLQDPRTRVFNFDPYLQTIMPVEEFDFNALKQYITSSRDDTLLQKAAEEKKKYTGSTSSMTSSLAHFHFLLSQWRLINVGNLSKMFPVQYHTFTGFQRVPIAIFLRYKNGTYAIDADKQFDSASVLSMLGKSMEKFLTLPTEDFERYRKGKSDQITDEERNEPEAFHYTTMGDFMMRSQLDAYDERLPGTGMFDLKTRAVVSVRMDTDSYQEGRGYQIRHRHGEWESFEREYYDMIRAAFLKYSLQVRMGRMDGIFVAFHNTERIFGFQYISLEEMDFSIHGTDDRRLGDAEFKISVNLLNRVLDRATAKYPEKSLRLHFETRDATKPFMYIFAEPVEEDQIEKIQASNADQIAEFEKKVLGLKDKELDQQKKQAQWDEIRAQVEKEMDKDRHDEDVENDDMTEEERHQIQALVSSNTLPEDLREEEGDEEAASKSVVAEDTEEFEDEPQENATDVVENGDIVEDGVVKFRPEVDPEELTVIADAEQDPYDTSASADIEEAEIEDTTLIVDAEADNVIDEDDDADQHVSTDEVADNKLPAHSDPNRFNPDGSPKDLLAMTLIIQNKVDGKYVAQPDAENYPPGSKWEVEYALAEVKNPHLAFDLYEKCKRRRKQVHSKSVDLSLDTYQHEFLEKIKALSRQGRKWRDEQMEIEANLPVKTLQEKPDDEILEEEGNVSQTREGKEHDLKNGTQLEIVNEENEELDPPKA